MLGRIYTLANPLFNQKCPELRINNVRVFRSPRTTRNYSCRYKRNRRADTVGTEHAVVVAEDAKVAANAPNASDDAIEGVRRQRPPISILRSIFL